MNDLTAARAAGAVRSRTVWLALLVSVLGAVQAQVPALAMDTQTTGVVLMAIGVAQIVLRWVTDRDLALRAWDAEAEKAGGTD